MNCKPGDLAFVVRQTKHGAAQANCLGMIVEVLYAAPTQSFNLPDGFRSTPGTGNDWVIKLARPIPVRTITGAMRMALYGKASDSAPRPIRPGGISDEEVRDLYAPSKEQATA